MSRQLLGIDWGSTNRRAYLVDAHGQCLRSCQDGNGMLAERGRFAESLGALRRVLEVGPDVPLSCPAWSAPPRAGATPATSIAQCRWRTCRNIWCLLRPNA
jgi:hypothetical protein